MKQATIDSEHQDADIEALFGSPFIQKMQFDKLKSLLLRLYAAKPFWKDRMDKAGLDPATMSSLDEFSSRMPVMDKAERRKITEECGGAVEMADRTIAVPIEDVVLMAATSGTTGEPTPYPHTTKDIEINSELFSRLARRAGIRRGDRIVHAFGLSMWLAGVPYVQFLQKSGACVLPVGAEAGSERILRTINQFRANVLFGTPSLIEHLIEKAPGIIGAPVSSLGIKTIICAGEPGAGIPEVREKIEQAYGAKLYDHGGSMGLSCDCEIYQGMHHFAEDYYYFELVNPETLEPLPFEHGARGLAVQTSLEHEGMLWVRETFGDIVEVLTEPCACGEAGFRYKVIGRVDDMLKVKGVMVYPAAIEGVIASFAPRVTGEFRIVLTEQPPRVTPPLKVKVEYGEDVPESELALLAKEIEASMRSRLKVSPEITWAKPFSLDRTVGKTQFFERNY
ncbi:MAG: AMP-binding protein [Marinicaulis sp.]|nr:AMP-binding protein [Marinicaulis sp.]NNL88503.1 AMP-binding protein [Marinicaulis sp.]